MAEWLIEHGIGETRALLVENGDAIAAQIQWPDELIPGLIEDAQLIHRPKASKRGVARFANGEEAMVDRLPADASEGAAIRLEVLRSAIIERGRTKPAQARPTQADCRPAPTLAEKLRGREVHHFPDGLWEDLWGQAADGTASFDGGALHFAPSAAMTLIDIDGHLQPRELALAAIAPLAAAIRQMGLGGNIAVDFPTLQAKADRKEVDERLGHALAGWEHERTAMNGFGLVQMVARLDVPSLLHRLHFQRIEASARMMLRRAEHVSGPGAILMKIHPAIKVKLKPEWLGELTRRTGREVRIEYDPGLAIEGGFAQAVPL